MTGTSPPPTDPPVADAGPSRPLHGFAQLRRSVTDRRIAGVAGGLGRYLGVDPTIIRVALVVAAFFGGSGFVLYVVAWLVVPEDGRDRGRIRTSPATRDVILIVTGVVAALLLLGDGWAGVRFPWPLLVIGSGVAIYLAVRHGSRQSPGATYPAAGPPVDPAAFSGSAPGAAPGAWGGSTAPPPWLPPTAAAPVYEPPRRKRGPLLFGPTLAAVSVALGALGIADSAGVHVVATAYAALALAVVGAMLVLGSVLGRPGGLILLGIVALLCLGITSAASGARGFEGHGRDRLHVAPRTADDVRNTYFMPAGQAVVDLSQVSDPTDLSGRSIEIGARAGEIQLVLPRGITSDVRAEVTGAGQIDLPGHAEGGIAPQLRATLGSGARTVTIRTHLFTGRIDVRNP